jgi:hypothetical protein
LHVLSTSGVHLPELYTRFVQLLVVQDAVLVQGVLKKVQKDALAFDGGMRCPASVFNRVTMLPACFLEIKLFVLVAIAVVVFVAVAVVVTVPAAVPLATPAPAFRLAIPRPAVLLIPVLVAISTVAAARPPVPLAAFTLLPPRIAPSPLVILLLPLLVFDPLLPFL